MKGVQGLSISKENFLSCRLDLASHWGSEFQTSDIMSPRPETHYRLKEMNCLAHPYISRFFCSKRDILLRIQNNTAIVFVLCIGMMKGWRLW